MAATTIAFIFFNRPSNGWIIGLCFIQTLALMYGFGEYPPRAHDGFQKFVRWGFLLLLCSSATCFWGWLWWQRIKVSPHHVLFEGYPGETFNFSIRNERSDDAYDIQIPFPIGHGKHWEDKLSANVQPNGDPPQRLHFDYNYCFGAKGAVDKPLPDEREVLIIRMPHLPAYGTGNFSVTYAGGEKFETEADTPSFSEQPYSYSPMQGTVGEVRGGYRICKVVIATDGLVGR